MERQAVLIAGPTASGKTAASIAIAARLGAIVVNADSMQVYAGLEIVTAQPSPEERAGVPHALFSHVDPSRRYSTGGWLADVEKTIQKAEKLNRPLVFVGGTGLYFEALTKGFARVPPVPEAMVEAVESEVAELDAAGRAALLAANDPELARALPAADPQRVVRAVSVARATGRPLSSFHAEPGPPLLSSYALERMVLSPPRPVLRARIAARFEAMMEGGAIEEVEALLARGLDPDLPARKAIGVPEIGAYLAGTLSRQAAIERAVTASRQLAKRQMTFLRGRMADWKIVDPTA